MKKQNIDKEALVAEYLAGKISLRKLSAKYGIRHQKLHKWVQRFQGTLRKKMALKMFDNDSETTVSVSSETKQIQKELRKEQLRNKLLNAMIDIAEAQLGISIRKKSGAKRS